ncbi:MAG: indole-3-glycerol phosphate synthase TrpC [Alphaproteobacteria bacterium]|nr:indole-3-glycerol phosphate synthase TrpC [Alphaproteobacteria bacterium]
MNTVLDKICDDKRAHIASKKSEVALSELESIAKEQETPRGFINALHSKEGFSLIAEVKKASPSKGLIRADFNAAEIAKIYQENGAACLSVLTDEPYFQGHDDYFKEVKARTSIPMLRKDFMVDPYQIVESRALGADCILIIMAALSDAQVKELYDLTNQYGMDALFEVHDGDELERALQLSPTMVGVNNRNLKTLDVSHETGLALATKMPNDILKVAESGLYSHDDLHKFSDVGYDAFLVGESLMREKNIAAAVQNLLRHPA